MDKAEAFTIFASTFVLPAFRERFVHEALEQPAKLLSRICHNINDVFSPTLVGNRATYEESAACFLLQGPRGFTATTWSKASRCIGLGEGCLIIDATGATFYAETEAVRGGPSIAYADGS